MSLPKQHAWMVEMVRYIARVANANEQFEIAEDLTSVADAYDCEPKTPTWADAETTALAEKRYQLAAMRLGAAANRGSRTTLVLHKETPVP